MANYDKENMTLTFTNEESEASTCPDCGAGLDMESVRVVDDEVVTPWSCPACGLKGESFGCIRFDRHIVDVSEVRRSELLSSTTRCINGILQVGDLVLSTVDSDLPCLPGRVIAIDLLDSNEHQTESLLDDVHVDFSVFSDEFSVERWQGIADKYALFCENNRSCETISRDDMIIGPDCLIKISDVAPETLEEIKTSEENAIRHAYRVVRGILNQQTANERRDW